MLYYIILYYSVLYYTTLYYTILCYWSWRSLPRPEKGYTQFELSVLYMNLATVYYVSIKSIDALIYIIYLFEMYSMYTALL